MNRHAARVTGSARALVLALAVAVCALGALPALAQPTADPDPSEQIDSARGKVAGQVLNGLTGQPVPGATLTIEGTDVEVTTDLNGMYVMQAPAGTYTVILRKEAFQTQKVTGVRIVAGEVANQALVLMPTSEEGSVGAASFAEGITVESEAGQATEVALLAERKAAAQISDAISAEEMSKAGGGDAAGVLKRVTGVSLQDDKFVYVRGLGDRYSNTTLNGSKIPSTELEKKVVPLNLFPAGLLDKISVSKSYTVDKPGDFAAGFVDLRTVEFPHRQQAQVGFSGGYNSVTTGDPILQYDGGLDFFGDGGQPLPSTVPSEPIFPESPFSDGGFSRDEIEEIGEGLTGTWTPSRDSSAPYDQKYKLSYGNTFDRFGMVLSTTYENEHETRQEERNFFAASGDDLVARNVYDVAYGEEKVRQSIAANLAYRFSDNDHVKLRSLFTDLSNAESRIQEGFFSDINSNLRDLRVSYQDQEILNAQLSGEHFMPDVFSAGSLLEWRVSGTQASTDENRREVNYEERREGQYVFSDNAQSGFMYFNDLQDDLYDAATDWTTFFTTGSTHGSIKVGGSYVDNEREFDGRRLRFDHRSTFGLDLTLPVEELLTPENIGPNFELEEITRPTDTYDGKHETSAVYAQADLAWGRWRLVGGVRAETSDIEVITRNRNNPEAEPDVTAVEDEDILPALNLVYQLGGRTNLRFAVSQTVNRPEFRELAPFKFVHLVGGFEVTGNPDLESATIRSYDARWEWFPRGGEVVAASVFYKDFDKPIETIQLAGAQRIETFENAEGAENWGAELELRRNLGSLWKPLESFTAILNYTYVESEVQIDPANTILTNPTRPLAGQPDQVGNLMLDWSRPRWGTSVRLLFNHVGDKVSRGGVFGVPDVIEEARSTFDIVWQQDLGGVLDGLSLKLSGSNLTDEDWLWTQGGRTFRQYEEGRSYGLSLTYELF